MSRKGENIYKRKDGRWEGGKTGAGKVVIKSELLKTVAHVIIHATERLIVR